MSFTLNGRRQLLIHSYIVEIVKYIDKYLYNYRTTTILLSCHDDMTTLATIIYYNIYLVLLFEIFIKMAKHVMIC